MAITFKTPTDVATEYLQHLKGLKPSINIDQEDSDWWVRSRVVGGVVAGVYADQRKISDDAFPQSARREALERHLNTYFSTGFNAAVESNGLVRVSGATGSVLPIGTEILYSPNGNVYATQATLTLVQPTGSVAVKSVSTGQDQNLLDGAQLVLSAPPPGFDPTAFAIGPIGDGKNDETNAEAAARILARLRNPPSGGTAEDYRTWAKEASASVTDVNVLRYIYGLGTVGLIIAAGTTDIDTAVTNGDPIVRIPSDALVLTVRDYVNAKKPLTDCVFYLKPVEVPIDVEMKVRWTQGDENTIPAGQTLTQGQLLKREIGRAIYLTPPGGRRFGASGFVVASEIEEVVDAGLSATPYTIGNFAQILSDRQVKDLSATGSNRLITEQEIAIPGNITLVSF